MAAYNKNGEDGLFVSKFNQRGHPAYAIESGLEPLVRQEVRRANRNGEPVNIKRIRCFMRDELHCEAAYTTLFRALQRWGFEFGTGKRTAQLFDKRTSCHHEKAILKTKTSES
jgi:hypothetical protein